MLRTRTRCAVQSTSRQSQAEQLGLAQPGERRGQNEYPQNRPEHVGRWRWREAGPATARRGGCSRDRNVWEGVKKPVELGKRQESELGSFVPVGPRSRRGHESNMPNSRAFL